MAYIMIIIFVLIIILAIFAFYANKIKREEYKRTKKLPKGHYMGIGIALGIPIGLPLAIAIDNMAFIGIGLPIGLAIGASLEKKHEKELSDCFKISCLK